MKERALEDLIRLDGQVAAVTGAGRGIGLAIASRLAEAGASVLVAEIDEVAAHGAAEQIAKAGGSARGLRVDVADEDDVDAMIGLCAEEYGGLDVLVNNAGIFPQVPISSMRTEDFRRVIDVNLTGLYLTTRLGSELMKLRGTRGRIVNVTSIDALHPSMVGLAHYDASKHGAWGFTKNAALELAEFGIRVNAIAPGGISTPGVSLLQAEGGAAFGAQVEAFLQATPMRRFGEPDEIARVALFLASELSSYMTGSQVVVDGGALLC